MATKNVPSMCDYCNKGFLGYTHRPNKFCSRDCCGKAKIGIPLWPNGREVPWAKGENNVQWKGDKVGLAGLHKRVEAARGKPTTCEKCGCTPPRGKDGRRLVHWANKSHKYRPDVMDFWALCNSCHVFYDMTKTWRKNMSDARKGKVPWNKGKKRHVSC